ncbi:MAG: metallophosphoesterase family protein [Candidatus Brocadiae bacterium]|nr:metallophosphoesterase family protein [Candidatus Brocadiia bacterium]
MPASSIYLGLISDIHGDMASLEKALDYFEREGVEKVLCMGDLVGKGSLGNQVVETIQSNCIPCVQGNHDVLAELNQKHAVEGQEILKSEVLEYLKKLPFTLYYIWENIRIRLVHGSPKTCIEYLCSTSSLQCLQRAAMDADSEILLHGHTHEATYAVHYGVHFYNPGSICGAEGRDSHTCATLVLPQKKWKVIQL